jgi:hypothetical protein
MVVCLAEGTAIATGIQNSSPEGFPAVHDAYAHHFFGTPPGSVMPSAGRSVLLHHPIPLPLCGEGMGSLRWVSFQKLPSGFYAPFASGEAKGA